MKASKVFFTVSLIAIISLDSSKAQQIATQSAATVPNNQAQQVGENVYPVNAQDRVQYERPDSQTVHYNAPDPLKAPDEMRIQDMERRIGDLESELLEIEKSLRDTIVSVNNLHKALGR